MSDIIQIVLKQAENQLHSLKKRSIDIIEINKPRDIQYAFQLTKLVSKLSPLLGNLFEFWIVDALNSKGIDYGIKGTWIRQDPGFPDARFVYENNSDDNIGVEIKAWFPFATEITGRFKDSETFFSKDQIRVAIVAWIPEYVFWGKPIVIDTLIISGKSIAMQRDRHYHQPPHYIVLEPEDTTERAGNLQQSNTNGYVFQDEKGKNKGLFDKAEREVESWGIKGREYSTEMQYQNKLKSLLAKYPYRNDTNYAKIDRIKHDEIENFKLKVLDTTYKGLTIRKWTSLFSKSLDNEELVYAVKQLLR